MKLLTLAVRAALLVGVVMAVFAALVLFTGYEPQSAVATTVFCVTEAPPVCMFTIF